MNLSHLPHTPGVYLMRDAQGRILYIGKAKDLCKRVASYFQNRPLPAKIAALKQCVQWIDYIPTQSERASLLLEQKLIRKFQPFFNTLWRDDKSYPILKLTLNEDVPRLFLTRKQEKDGAVTFGPFPNVQVIRRLLHTLRRKKLFTLRPCSFPFRAEDLQAPGGLSKSQPLLWKKVESCIYLHTGACPAPCTGKISLPDYRKIAKRLQTFLQGNVQPLRKLLEQEMKKSAKAMHYEKAADLRNQISALEQFSEKITFREVDEEQVAGQIAESRALTELQEKLNLPRPPLRMEAIDISNIQATEPVGVVVVFERGKPLKSEYRKFKIKTVPIQKGMAVPNDFAMIEEVVERRIRRILREGKKLPDLLLLDGGKGQLSSALKALHRFKMQGSTAQQFGGKMHIAALAKEREEIFLPEQSQPILLPKESPALQILQRIRDEAHRFALSFHRHRRSKLALQGLDFS